MNTFHIICKISREVIIHNALWITKIGLKNGHGWISKGRAIKRKGTHLLIRLWDFSHIQWIFRDSAIDSLLWHGGKR